MSAATARVRIERRITREAVRASLPELLGFAIEVAREAGFDEQTAHAVRLAVEEACVNVIDHGYAGAPPGPIELTIADEASQVRIEVADRARPFAPEAIRAPELEAAVEDRPIGGLGWFLIGELMDEVRHAPREGGGNRLTMIRRLERAAPN
ncbi:ATP-binding protein [Burkholderiaceae bacterium FT117]|uniref:ATP-binding protein n=1 Tax=Zeimonas sediminis TaxID=2944268 RepID=UPI002342D90A|nr:ATP-binding protein [Zeimonas sediminis]MCM5571630.1 ATP-binding protein [Zeimonas sediminis]